LVLKSNSLSSCEHQSFDT